jgi:hypothetical protein
MNAQQGARKGTKIISKSQVEYRDRAISPIRLAGAGMGGAAMAYGVPRLQMLGDMVTRGTKSPKPGTQAAAQTTQQAMRVAEHLTEPLGRATAAGLRKTPEGIVLMRWSPRSFRPALATGLGAYLLARSTPVTKDRVRPITGVTMRGQ